MAKLAWALMCSKHIIDANSNLTSLIDITENIDIEREEYFEEGKKWIAISARYTIVCYLLRSDLNVPEDIVMRMTVVSPTGEKHPQPLEIQIDLSVNDRVRTFINMSNILFIESGSYSYVLEEKIKNDWVQIGEIPITMNQTTKRSN